MSLVISVADNLMSWNDVYSFLGITDFVYFISSPSIQDLLFPIKLVFIFFTIFFFCAVMYFYVKSTYIKFLFLQDVSEFFSWQAYGFKGIDRRWKNITKRIELGSEREYKLAIIEADDFLYQTLENKGYKGETFEELINGVNKKILPNFEDVLSGHGTRNSIVYDPDYKLDLEKAKKILSDYESAVKNISAS